MTWLEEHWNEIVALPRVRTRRPRCAVAGCPLLSQALGLRTAHYTVARKQFDPQFRKRYLAMKRDRDQLRRAARESSSWPQEGAGDAGAAHGDAGNRAAHTDTRRP